MQLSEEEWGILNLSQKTLYSDVMLDIYKLATSLGKAKSFPLCVSCATYEIVGVCFLEPALLHPVCMCVCIIVLSFPFSPAPKS